MLSSVAVSTTASTHTLYISVPLFLHPLPQPNDIPSPSAKKRSEADRLRSTQAVDSLLSSLSSGGDDGGNPVAETKAVSFKTRKDEGAGAATDDAKKSEGRDATATTKS